MLNKLGLITIGASAILSGCSSMESVTDFTGLTHYEDQRQYDAKKEKQKAAQQHYANCRTKQLAWGELYTGGRRALLSKVDPKGEKLTMDTAPFYSLPYQAVLCPTRASLVDFENSVSNMGGFTYSGKEDTELTPIRGTSCYRTSFVDAAVGIKITSYKQAGREVYEFFWRPETLPREPVRIAWTSTYLNSAITDYRVADKQIEARKLAYRIRVNLPDDMPKEYAEITCENHYIAYQIR